jgi:hypothetical protein
LFVGEFVDAVEAFAGSVVVGGEDEVGVFGGEAFLGVIESNEIKELAGVLGGEGRIAGQGLGGVGCGGGDVELGAEAEDFAEAGEGVLKCGAAEPSAEDGDGGPLVGRRAGGVGAEGSEKSGLGVGCSFDAWHIRCSFLWSYVFWVIVIRGSFVGPEGVQWGS